MDNDTGEFLAIDVPIQTREIHDMERDKRIKDLEYIIEDTANRVHRTHHWQHVRGHDWKDCPMMVCQIAQQTLGMEK